MLQLKNEKVAIPVVLFAGLLWSFGPLVVRYMNEPNLVPWQYLFQMGLMSAMFTYYRVSIVILGASGGSPVIPRLVI